MKADLILPMVNMAIQDIESKDILPGYRLQLYVNDTQVREMVKAGATQASVRSWPPIQFPKKLVHN